MNGITTVDASIAERVLATAAELEYSPSGTARSLSLGVTHTVAMMVPDLGNPMFQEILKGFHHAAGADGYRVLVSDSQEVVADEVALARDARRRCDAVVLCAPRSSGEALVDLLRTVQPAVVINRSTQGGVAPAVTIDYAAGIRLSRRSPGRARPSPPGISGGTAAQRVECDSDGDTGEDGAGAGRSRDPLGSLRIDAGGRISRVA